MENASKALLMAAGILIGVTILVIAVFLFSSFSKFASTYEETSSESDITRFNNNFTKFVGRKDITPQEIATLLNFIKQGNYESDVVVSIDSQKVKNVDITKFLQDNITNKYKCISINYDENTAFVKGISFSKV